MDMILKNTFQSISPAYELIGDVTVGSNTTQVDFTGLNIGKDDELLLVSGNSNPTGNGASVWIFYNGDTTQSNYYAQHIRVNNTSVTSARLNGNTIFYNEWGQKLSGFTTIKLTNSGYAVTQSSVTERVGNSTVELWNFHSTSTFTMTSITSIRLYANQSGTIGTGSRFQLYKLVAEKVADIIVPSNTTSVDITGLNIGKDVEYYLVSDVVSSLTSSTSGYQLLFNSNNTTTNYYRQAIFASATSVGGGRLNNSEYLYTADNANSFVTTNIKLTNSGYIITQNNSSENYRHKYNGGALIQISKRYNTTTYTSSAITSLRILANTTNAIGANSRFTLYKMK